MEKITRTPALDSNKVTEEYFDEILVEMLHIGSTVPDTGLELFGKHFDTPIMTAALSHIKGLEGDGMVQMAEGAAQAGALTWVGMTEAEQFAAIAATGAPLVRIIKPYADEKEIFSRIEQAEELGALAVGMDVGHIFNSRGQPDTVVGKPMRPQTFEDIQNYCKRTKLPFIVKDVLSAREAQMSLDAGAGDLLVSHHHGIMASAVPPLMVLPEIVKAVNGRVPVFVDCSITNGVNAFKALALGATAVNVGRVLMQPIREKGAEGARQVIEDITGELAGMMARTGSHDLGHIDPTILWCRDGLGRILR